MNEGNCQQIYHTIVDFCSSKEQTLTVSPFFKIALSHICWVFYWSETYLIRKGNFFTRMVTHFCNFNMIRIFWISQYCSNTYFHRFIDLYAVLTITQFIYTKTKEGKIKTKVYWKLWSYFSYVSTIFKHRIF